MPLTVSRIASAALALALAAASTPLAAKPATDGMERAKPSAARHAETTRTAPATGASRHAHPLYTFEDQPLTIEPALAPAESKLVLPPKHGTLLTGSAPMVYVPYPDFHGEDRMAFSTGLETVELVVKVVAVNDPPRFTPGSGASHLASDHMVHVVPGWATGISAGPDGEAIAQGLWFGTEAVADPDGVLAWLEVDKEGTLSYALTGRAGVARWAVRAYDDGGDEYGGSSASDAHEIAIGVDMIADLAIRIVALELPPALGQPRSYQLVVRNLGKAAASGARVVDVPAKGGTGLSWRCSAFGGASCPKALVGHGAVDTGVDLPDGGVVVFTVDGATTLGGDGSHSAFVEPPAYLEDPDLSNNEASE